MFLKSEEKKSYRQSLSKQEQIHFSMVGSPEYMAPEILASGEFEGSSYDHRVDYWALGCILYEYLAGFPPFTSPDQDEVWLNLSKWQEVLVRPIFEDETLNENFSDLAWDLINRLIAPADTRYSTMDQVGLHPYFAGIDWKNMRQSDPPFVPQLESETDPSYFDDFTNSETVNEMYAEMEQHQRNFRIESESNPQSSYGASVLPSRSAFIGFTYRHRSKHFSPPGTASSSQMNNPQSEQLRSFF